MLSTLPDLLQLLADHSEPDYWIRQSKLVLQLWDLAKLDADQFDTLVDRLARIQRSGGKFLERLEHHGITEGRLFDLLHGAIEGEAHRLWANSAYVSKHPRSQACVDCVTELYLRSVEPHQLDHLLHEILAPGDAQAIITATKPPTRLSWAKARQVVSAHYQGHAHAEVSRLTGVSYNAVKAVLASIGEVPRTNQVRLEGRAVRQAVRRFKAEHPQATWREISAATKASENQIRNALRGRKKGAAE